MKLREAHDTFTNVADMSYGKFPEFQLYYQ